MSKIHTSGQRVREVRHRLNLNQQELADRMMFSRNYISQVESGRDPGHRFLRQLEALEVVAGIRPAPDVYKSPSGSQLYPPVELPEGSVQETCEQFVRTAARQVPVVSMTHAGRAETYEELPLDWQETVPTDARGDRVFGLRVEGDSMEPTIRAGDVVIVGADAEPRENSVVVVRFKNDGVVLRLFSTCDREGEKLIRLSAYNPLYSPEIVHPDKVSYIFQVEGLYRRMGL